MVAPNSAFSGFMSVSTGPGATLLTVSVLGNAQAIYPYDHPALFSMPLAFLVTVIVSRLDRSVRAEKERDAYADQFVRAQTGLGAASASSH